MYRPRFLDTELWQSRCCSLGGIAPSRPSSSRSILDPLRPSLSDNVSPHTAAAYRDALKLLLRFARDVAHRSVATLRVWVGLARVWAGWRQALVIVSPGTVLRWQRRRFREYCVVRDGAGIKMRLLKTRSVRINNRNYCGFSGLLARISGKLFFGDQGSLMA